MSSRLWSVWHDIRFGGRQLRRSPGFFAAAVATLALGISANTAMFSVLYGVLLKPLPFDQPERLVSVWNTAPRIGSTRMVLAPAQYFTYREEHRAFEDLAVWRERSARLTGTGDPVVIPTLMVTDGFLSILRVQPVLGRRFSREDDQPGGPSRVIITYGCWQRRFGGDTRVVGRQATIDGTPREIIGVLPQHFKFLETTAEMLVPLGFDRADTRIQDFSYRGLARLKPGVTLEQAASDAARMLPLVPQKFAMPDALSPTWFQDAKMGPDVHLLSQDATGDVGSVLWVLMGTIGMVMLIACANVTNLFLVRAEGLRQELAIRAALGAGRGRLVRTLLSESVMLGLSGGVVGIALAAGSHPRRAGDGSRCPAAGDRDRSRFHRGRLCGGALGSGRPALRPGSRAEGRVVAASGGAQGWWPHRQRQPRPSPHAQRARGDGDCAGAGAADLVGADDPDVPGASASGPWLHAR